MRSHNKKKGPEGDAITITKLTKKTKSKIEKVPSLKPAPAPADLSLCSDSESEDDEDDGVDEEGIKRLMELLGDDGLDETGRAELAALVGGGKDDEDEGEEEGPENEEGDCEDDDGEEEDEAGEDKEIPLDEADSVDEDAVPHQRVEIDDKIALKQICETIQLDSSLPWTETLVVSYPETIKVDVDDDLNREVAFYKQALHGANAACTLAAKHKLPFTRPSDYFAEMVKSDAHMERIRQRLLNESAGIKKSEDKRKEREGKKFGKQVQIEKLKERERSKKEVEEKLKGLKRKRKDVLDNPQRDDDFDIQVEEAISDRPTKRGKGANGKSIPRSVRDKKFGFGGATRHAKQNTRESTDNFDLGPGRGKGSSGRGRGNGGGFSGRGGGGRASGRHKTKRLGKSRRASAKTK